MHRSCVDTALDLSFTTPRIMPLVKYRPSSHAHPRHAHSWEFVKARLVKNETHADTGAWRIELLAGEKPFAPTEPTIARSAPRNQVWHSFGGHREGFVKLARQILDELEPTPSRALDTLLRIEKLLENNLVPTSS